VLKEAFAPKQASSLPERVRARATGSRPGSAVDPVTTVNTEALRDWIEGVAAQVDTPSVDSTLAVEGRELIVTPSRRGVRVDVPATTEALTKGLTQGTKQVDLVVDYTEPKVTEDTIGKAILVRRSDRLLLLYNNGKVEKRYSVASGDRPDTPHRALVEDRPEEIHADMVEPRVGVGEGHAEDHRSGPRQPAGDPRA